MSVMDTRFLLKGLLLGFSIAAPVGPIGILCIRRTVADGRASGFVSGLGAATADALYGCIAGFGLKFISSLILGLHAWLNLVGGLFLLYLGIRTFVSRPATEAAQASGSGLLGAYGSTLALTLTNPMTILSFAATFAGLGLVPQPGTGIASGRYAGAVSLVLGVFAGSAFWWLLLSGGVSLFRTRLSARLLRWLNRISGLVLVGFGVWSLVNLLPELRP
jgi:threonine/homoserine/homoserine lactone efflux protein